MGARTEQIAYAAGGQGGHAPGAPARSYAHGPSVPVYRSTLVAYAAGGQGRPRPRHPRPGTASLGSL